MRGKDVHNVHHHRISPSFQAPIIVDAYDVKLSGEFNQSNGSNLVLTYEPCGMHVLIDCRRGFAATAIAVAVRTHALTIHAIA